VKKISLPSLSTLRIPLRSSGGSRPRISPTEAEANLPMATTLSGRRSSSSPLSRGTQFLLIPSRLLRSGGRHFTAAVKKTEDLLRVSSTSSILTPRRRLRESLSLSKLSRW